MTCWPTPEFAGMFRGEATVLASLDDPNVIRLYEYVESPAGAAIVMELIGGVPLREILTLHGKTIWRLHHLEAALMVLQSSLVGLAAGTGAESCTGTTNKRKSWSTATASAS